MLKFAARMHRNRFGRCLDGVESARLECPVVPMTSGLRAADTRRAELLRRISMAEIDHHIDSPQSAARAHRPDPPRPRSRLRAVRLRRGLDRLPHSVPRRRSARRERERSSVGALEGGQGFAQTRFVRGRHLAKRQAHFARHQSAPGKRRFHRDRIRFDEEIFEKPRQPLVDFLRSLACRHSRTRAPMRTLPPAKD